MLDVAGLEPMDPIVGIIADDLTGGLETAAMLVAMGVDCKFATDPATVQALGSAPAIVVAQKTRVIPAADAVRRSKAAAEALLASGAGRLFFKYCATFDSTDEGNIGPVADMLLALTAAPFTAYCPAAPISARTVYNGHLFLGQQLVSDSPKRLDPLTPMTDPNLVRVLQRQTNAPVGLLPHRIVSGALLEASVAEQAASGVRHFITDTIYDQDLDAVAALTLDWKVMTGNATIMQHYPPLWRARGWLDGSRSPEGLPAVGGGGAVLSGSCADRSLVQLAHFERTHPVLRIDLLQVSSAAEAVEQALSWAGPHLARGPVGIATSETPDAVRMAQDRYGRDGAAKLAEDILSGVAAGLRNIGVRRIVVSGGETSGSIVEKLGVRSLKVGAYGGPGIGRAVTEEADPIAFCLKSGKLGPDDIFQSTLDSMLKPEHFNAIN
ncbi:four-carbon acid sugar kinase family protein [Corticibacterium sp. UT-5YL-CI-8]|nr:four-carbon acid sugar kinase family protein [Tianweitania sp. UT-5YL-CI-8]